MKEKQFYLSNGDLLIRTEEGIYFRQDVGISIPILIDREEGENLLFETNEQMKKSLEALFDSAREWQALAEKYGEALEEIADFDHGNLEQTEIAIKALKEEEN